MTRPPNASTHGEHEAWLPPPGAWHGPIEARPTRQTHTTPSSYLSLAALFLIGVAAVLWLRHEAIVVWLLAEGLIGEQGTRTLSERLQRAGLVFGIAGAVAGTALAAHGLRLVYGWPPVHRFAAPLVEWLHRLLRSIWRPIGAVLLAVRSAITLALRRAWHAASTALEGIRSVAAAVLRRLWRGISAVARPVALGVRRVGRVLWRMLSAVWLTCSAAARHAGRAVAAMTRAVWLVLVAVVGQLGLIVVLPLYAAWLAVSMLSRILGQAIASAARAVEARLRALARPVAVAAGALWVAVTTIVGTARSALSRVARNLGQAIASAARAVEAGLRALGRPAAIAAAATRDFALTVARTVTLALAAVARVLRRAIVLPLYASWVVIAGAARLVGWVLPAVARASAEALRELSRRVAIVASVLRARFVTIARPLWLGVSAIVQTTAAALLALRLGVASAIRQLRTRFLAALKLAAAPLLRLSRWVVLAVARPFLLTVLTLTSAAGAGARAVWIGASTPLRGLWQAMTGAALVLRRSMSAVAAAGRRGGAGCWWIAKLVARTGAMAVLTVWELGRAATGAAQGQRGVSAMFEATTRERMLSLIATIWVLGIGGFFLVGLLRPPPPEPTVVVEHWATGHLFRDGLLREMADEFNDEEHRMPDGTRIVIKVWNVPSQLQGDYLIERIRDGVAIDLEGITDGYVLPNYSDPTIVTPSSAHWLVDVNYELGHEVVDLAAAPSIVRPVIGIVTYEDMARCLGWPEQELGFADILALRADPEGWAAYPCAKAEWGQRPLMAFTDPATSSTGRSLLLALYAIAAGKLPEDLTAADVTDPKVVRYVKEFQGLVDHYLIGTTVLNTKIHQGPRYGHFFIMPEDNLIHLYEGTERAFIGGVKVTPPPIEERMVMIYPSEGSMPRSNCGCIVQAPWVSDQQVEAAEEWLDFLREDDQQRAFMAAGFRPGTDISLADPSSKITSEFGLDPTKPSAVLNPSLIDPAVAAAIDESWVDVKRPAIVTFVVDTSGSMLGKKLREAQDGLVAALDAMAANNQVGLVAFDNEVHSRVPVGPLAQNRFAIADAVHALRAGGETALYDAIKAGIEMTDTAEGPPNAIRAVVVLTDGRANRGRTRLDDLIKLMSRDEVSVAFSGMDGESAYDTRGNQVGKESIVGIRLAVPSGHPDQPVQVFFIGIGDDADLDIGRLLAGATSAEFQGVTEEDLAHLLAEISGYF